MTRSGGSPSPFSTIPLRTNLEPGDLGTVVGLHGAVYAEEHGFDHTSETYWRPPGGVLHARLRPGAHLAGRATAARRYTTFGSQSVEEKPGRLWGVEVVQKPLQLGPSPPP